MTGWLTSNDPVVLSTYSVVTAYSVVDTLGRAFTCNVKIFTCHAHSHRSIHVSLCHASLSLTFQTLFLKPPVDQSNHLPLSTSLAHSYHGQLLLPHVGNAHSHCRALPTGRHSCCCLPGLPSIGLRCSRGLFSARIHPANSSANQAPPSPLTSDDHSDPTPAPGEPPSM